MPTKTETTLPPKRYATVLATGESSEWPNKRKAVLYGEASGQDFTVLSPRGFECHFGKAPEPKPVTIKAKDLTVGTVARGTVKRDPVRKIDRISVGPKHVTGWSGGKCFLYAGINEAVEIA